jgi:predicted MFS family arabinose efflux permease
MSATAKPAYVWYVIALLSTVNVFNYLDRMALAVLLPFVKADLRLSDSQLGLLIGFAFFVFYAFCGIPIARWADRGNRRNTIALALLIWSVMTAICGAAQSFWQLFLARVGVGVGEAGGLSPAQSMLCDYVPLERRSGVFSIHSFGLIVGMMAGMALAGVLGERLGWRWTLVALGLPGVLLAVVVRFTLREPQRGGPQQVGEISNGVSLLEAIGVLWRCRTYRLLMLLTVVNGFIQYGLNQWWPSLYTRVFGLSMSVVGTYLGFGIGAGAGIGMLFGGLLGNRLAQRDVRLPLIVGVAATVLALPAAVGSLFFPSFRLSVLMVAITGFLWSIPAGPIVATVYSVVQPSMRATAGAISVFFSSVLGFGLGPYCVGAASDLLTPAFGIESLRYALLIPVSLLPVLATVLLAVAKAFPNDLQVADGQV